MSECTTKSVYESIEACPGQRNLAGIRRRVYYIAKSKIATWPKLPAIGADNVTMAALAKYTGDFELAQGESFKFIDLKDDQSNALFETVGEEGSKLYNNQSNLIVAGVDDAVKGFCREVVNEDLIFVFQQRNGKFCVLGNETFVCKTNPQGDTGTEVTGAITTTIAVQVYDECPFPTYEGKLKIGDNKYINCSTGQEEQDDATQESNQQEQEGEGE